MRPVGLCAAEPDGRNPAKGIRISGPRRDLSVLY